MNYAVNIMNETNNIDDEDLLLNAIEDYGAYSPCTKKVLCTFLDLAVDNVINITPTELSNQLDFSRMAIYDSLKVLLRDNTVRKLAKAHFELNNERLRQILQIYNKKQKFFNSSIK